LTPYFAVKKAANFAVKTSTIRQMLGSNRVAAKCQEIPWNMCRKSHGHPHGEIQKKMRKMRLGRPHGKSICPSCHGVWDLRVPESFLNVNFFCK
jgi:Zn-finger nucleic acid-binding protein